MAEDEAKPNSAATSSPTKVTNHQDSANSTYGAEQLGDEGGKTNEAFLLEWEPDESPTPSHLSYNPHDEHYHYENTNNNARITEASQADANKQQDWSHTIEGVELSNISLPNDTSPSRKANSKAEQVGGKAWTDVKKMSVADVNGHALSEQQLEEDKRQQQELRDREPLRFCKWVAEKPGLLFGE